MIFYVIKSDDEDKEFYEKYLVEKSALSKSKKLHINVPSIQDVSLFKIKNKIY